MGYKYVPFVQTYIAIYVPGGDPVEPSVLFELVELLAVMELRCGMEMEVGGPRRGESEGAGAWPRW